MSSQESLSARLRMRRLEVGLSQGDLAGDELSSSYISLIESGKRQPTAAVLDLLASRLDTTPGFLLEGVQRASSDQLDLRLRHAEVALHRGAAEQALAEFDAVRTDAIPGSAAARDSAWGAARAVDAAGRAEAAIAAYEELHQTLSGHEVSVRWAEVTAALTRCYADLGDLSRAVDLGEAARERMAELSMLETPQGARLLSALIATHLLRGDEPRAEELSESLERVLASIGSPAARATVMLEASRGAGAAGDLDGARALAERAIGIVRIADDARSYAHLGVVGAWLLLRSASPDPERARAMVDAARTQLEAEGEDLDLAACDVELARVSMVDGDLAAAEQLLRDVIRRTDATTVVSWRAQVLLGEVLCKRGDVAAGRELMLAGTQRLESSGLSRMAAEAWRSVADLLAEQGSGDDALEAYRRALALLGITSSSVRPVPVGAPISS